jgi:hypothetical protein
MAATLMESSRIERIECDAGVNADSVSHIATDIQSVCLGVKLHHGGHDQMFVAV